MLQFVLFCGTLLALACGQTTTGVSSCINHAGELPINTYIEGCVAPPCLLTPLQDFVINMEFEAPRSMSSMRTLATFYINAGFIPLPVPYDLGQSADTCSSLNSSCPVAAGTQLHYTLRKKVEAFFPVGTAATLELRVVDQDGGPVTCIRVPIRIEPTTETPATTTETSTTTSEAPTTTTTVSPPPSHLQCIHNAGELPTSTQIQGCGAPPCLIPQLQDLVVSMEFTATRSMSFMRTLATFYINAGFIPLPVPYDLGQSADTCSSLSSSCPVAAGTQLQYTLREKVEAFFPVGTAATLELRVVDQDGGPVTCIRVPIRIEPPVDTIAYMQ